MKSKIFLIDQTLLNDNSELAVINMFKILYNFIINNNHIKTIFCHNLGNFDGFFIYKYFSKVVDEITDLTSLIDQHNKFVAIKIDRIIFKDSKRIFDMSLDKLCKNFNVEGKISSYKNEFNNVKLFNDKTLLDEFKNYALQDSICLLNALMKAQEVYVNQYNIDIVTILSTSTLSLKIFRKKFLKYDIPVLTHKIDSFIRNSYYGGATDYYKFYGKNLYYYDVNSLYPWAMKQPMPYKITKYHNDLSNIDLNNFFGFCEVEVETPNNILKPFINISL